MTISGMQITTAELTSDIGLFGYVKGTLKNFRVVNANVSTGENGSNIGIACGYSAGVVSGISVSGYLTAEGFTYVGGVLGRSEMTGNSTFSALYNTADITGKEYVGGVIGYMKSYQSGSGGTIMDIEECSNAGKITASGDYVGGLFGYILKDNNYYHNQRLYMIELVNEGDVTTDGSYVGGIVGYVFANSGSYIKTSTSGVSVSGKGYVGGIAGKLENIEINNCNNRGTKVAAKYITEEYSKAYLGGYVGYGDAVKNCNNATEINYEHAAFYVGGIAGYLTGEMSSCVNTAKINAPKASYVGGLLGYSEKTGDSTFTVLHNTADVTGKEYVGGLIGYIRSYQSGSSVTTMNIGKCSNKGKITGSEDYVGGLFGYILKDNDYYHNQRLYMTELTNEGNVSTDGSYVGGIAGYILGNNGSYIKTSASGVSVSGKGYVGGIAGKLENVTIDNCDNSGTALAAKYITEEYSKAYLGGYVGCGYIVRNCNNATEINYEHAAFYVGGIAGYLTGEMSDCTNTAKINAPKASYVGGLLGYSEKTGDSTFTILHNTADVTGKEYVGGVIGYMKSYQSGSGVTTMTIGKCSNKGKITASGNYAGGLFGYILKDNDYYHNQRLYMTELTNAGDVSANGSYVGGVAGYILGNNGSYIKTSASSVSVSGKGYVGGIAGKMENVVIDNCDNSGTMLTAKYITEEYSKAYLGGYVGYGYIVKNCTNATGIEYPYAAFYVGGIAGYLTGEMSDCTNTAKIYAPKASYVGGLLGATEKTGDSTFMGLHNIADVTGKEYVGGVAGYIKSYQSGSGVTTMTMGECSNKGTITANGNYAGGLFGYILKDNDYYHNQKLYMTDMTNEGDVRVVGNYAGGIAGYVYANDGSKLQNYATAGSVSGNLFCDTVIGFISNLEIVAN